MDDFGVPGAMVHFIEGFSPQYEPFLVDSIRRCPSMHTLWMLNRCINAEHHKDEYMGILAEVAGREDVDKAIRDSAAGKLWFAPLCTMAPLSGLHGSLSGNSRD